MELWPSELFWQPICQLWEYKSHKETSRHKTINVKQLERNIVQKAHIQRTIAIEQSSWKFHSPMFLWCASSAWNLKEVKLSIKTICFHTSFLKNFLDLYTNAPHSLWWWLLWWSVSSMIEKSITTTISTDAAANGRWHQKKYKQTNKQTLIISKCDWWERDSLL
jgi:hypothetical protein